jgi:hypothetical protein
VIITVIKVISSIEREGKFAPLRNKVQLYDVVFGGGEIALSIITPGTKWI